MFLFCFFFSLRGSSVETKLKLNKCAMEFYRKRRRDRRFSRSTFRINCEKVEKLSGKRERAADGRDDRPSILRREFSLFFSYFVFFFSIRPDPLLLYADFNCCRTTDPNSRFLSGSLLLFLLNLRFWNSVRNGVITASYPPPAR